MNKRYAVLGIAILLTGAILAAFGTYIKYNIIKPLNLPEYMEKSVFELPFLYYTDDVLQFMLENGVQSDGPGDDNVIINTRPTKPSSGATIPVPPVTSIPDGSTGSTGSLPPVSSSDPATSVPITSIPTTSNPTETTRPTVSIPSDWQFPGPPAEDAWFDDVLFIGNSRIEGLKLWARIGNAHYFAGQSMNVFNAYDRVISDGDNFTNATLSQVLANNQYGKIIIGLGINDAGYSVSVFKSGYEKLINTIKEAQPNAIIIIHGVIPVSRNYAGNKSYFQPSHIQKMNAQISSLADWETVFYFDFNEYVTDADGFLASNLTSDGCHFGYNICRYWRDWIRYICATI